MFDNSQGLGAMQGQMPDPSMGLSGMPAFAAGGLLGGSGSGPSDAPQGLVASPIAGRTDHIPVQAKPNSYVIPADVVSGLGQGNTLAGGRILDAMFQGHDTKAFANGGSIDDSTPIIIAGGEYVCDPGIVKSLGDGDPNKGHELLDKMVLSIRKQTIHQLKKLPGPVK